MEIPQNPQCSWLESNLYHGLLYYITPEDPQSLLVTAAILVNSQGHRINHFSLQRNL
jgi:hypothetical protein